MKIIKLSRGGIYQTEIQADIFQNFSRGGRLPPKLQAEILQNSQEVEVINQDYRQTYYKIPKRHEYLLTKHILRNINQLSIIQGINGKSSSSPGGIETIVWKIYSYKVPDMARTNASTNENHKFYNSTLQAI